MTCDRCDQPLGWCQCTVSGAMRGTGAADDSLAVATLMILLDIERAAASRLWLLSIQEGY